MAKPAPTAAAPKTRPLDYRVEPDGSVNVRDASGAVGSLPEAKALELFRAGQASPLTEDQRNAAINAQEAEGLADSPVAAGVLGALRGATLGASDLLLRGIAGDSADRVMSHQAALKAANPIASTAGEIVGAVGSSIVPGGALARIGAAGTRAGIRTAERIVGKLADKASTAARATESLLPRLGEAAFSGAAQGAGAGLSDAAIKGKVDPLEIAGKAALGAAAGSVLSLAGAGVGALASKGERAMLARFAAPPASPAATGARTFASRGEALAAAEATSVASYAANHVAIKADAAILGKLVGDPATRNALAKTQAALAAGDEAALAAGRSELATRLAGWRPRSGVAPEALEQALASSKAALQGARVEAFRKSAETIAGSRQALGLVGYFSTESWLAGVAGWGLGSLLKSKLALKASGAATRGVGAVGGAAAATARPAAVSLLTRDKAESLKRELEGVEPRDVMEAAARGYAAGGLEQSTAAELAAFQAARVELLKAELPNPKSALERQRYAKLLDAAQNPRGIVGRIKRASATAEDLLVLRTLFPRLHAQLEEEARDALRDGKLEGRARRQAQQIAEGEEYRLRAQAIQSIGAAAGAPPRPPQTSKLPPLGHGPLQRMAAGGLFGGVTK